jgi:Flp pilus assembly protein TadG
MALPRNGPERGATLVEFAFIALMFLTMLFGIIEFSRALYAYHFVDNAAKTATRWAAVNGYSCDDDGTCNGTDGMNDGPVGPSNATLVQDYVRGLAPMGINPSEVTAVATWPVESTDPNCDSTSPSYIAANYPGCTVEVTVSYKFHFLFPFIHTGPITMSSSSEMIITH